MFLPGGMFGSLFVLIQVNLKYCFLIKVTWFFEIIVVEVKDTKA